MNLPDYFRNQLPDGIRQMVDHADYNPLGEWVDGYTHMVQYTYPVIAGNGKPSDTTLASISGPEPMSFEPGQEVCLYGVWAEIESVDTVTERADDDGRLITWHTVVVRERSQR